jgi:hypothetical protein
MYFRWYKCAGDRLNQAKVHVLIRLNYKASITNYRQIGNWRPLYSYLILYHTESRRPEEMDAWSNHTHTLGEGLVRPSFSNRPKKWSKWLHFWPTKSVTLELVVPNQSILWIERFDPACLPAVRRRPRRHPGSRPLRRPPPPRPPRLRPKPCPPLWIPPRCHPSPPRRRPLPPRRPRPRPPRSLPRTNRWATARRLPTCHWVAARLLAPSPRPRLSAHQARRGPRARAVEVVLQEQEQEVQGTCPAPIAEAPASTKKSKAKAPAAIEADALGLVDDGAATHTTIWCPLFYFLQFSVYGCLEYRWLKHILYRCLEYPVYFISYCSKKIFHQFNHIVLAYLSFLIAACLANTLISMDSNHSDPSSRQLRDLLHQLTCRLFHKSVYDTHAYFPICLAYTLISYKRMWFFYMPNPLLWYCLLHSHPCIYGKKDVVQRWDPNTNQQHPLADKYSNHLCIETS